MMFIIVFIILYGLGFGLCRLAAMLFTGTDADLIKNIAFVPVMNVITLVIIVFFLFYVVKDYRQNKKKEEEDKEE